MVFSLVIYILKTTHLLDILPLGDILVAHFDSWVAQPLKQVS